MCSALLSQWPARVDPLQRYLQGNVGTRKKKKSSICTRRSLGWFNRRVQSLSHLIMADRAVSEGAIISTPYGVEVQPPPHTPASTKTPKPGGALLCAMNFKGSQE